MFWLSFSDTSTILPTVLALHCTVSCSSLLLVAREEREKDNMSQGEQDRSTAGCSLFLRDRQGITCLGGSDYAAGDAGEESS